jgi:aminocarboxymuconate-semialdehyde decarboxylase
MSDPAPPTDPTDSIQPNDQPNDQPIDQPIDLHCHLIPEPELSLPYLPMTFGTGDQREQVYYHGASVGPIRTLLTDAHEAVREMDRVGLAQRAMSIAPLSYRYDLPAQEGLSWHAALNDALAAACAEHPDRLVPIGIVPLQDAEAAAGEARRAVQQLHMRGIEIGTQLADTGLDDPRLEPFWSEVEELGVALFIHPEHVPNPVWSDYYLINLIGNPVLTAVAVARLIFGGVVDRHPGLRFWLAHGGGVAPSLAGRLRHGWQVRAETRASGASDPMQLLSTHFWFDSLTHDPATTAALVNRFGADRVVLGSDSPFDMQDVDPWASLLTALPDRADRERVVGASHRLLRATTRV